MFNNVALDVFIGLVFIFLLYSLLATIVQEFIATRLAFRAKVLEKALLRMLEDGKTTTRLQYGDRIQGFLHLLGLKNLLKGKNIVPWFYAHPLIKYLAEDNYYSKPAYLDASNFSKVVIDLLKGFGFPESQTVQTIHNSIMDGKIYKLPINLVQKNDCDPKPDKSNPAIKVLQQQNKTVVSNDLLQYETVQMNRNTALYLKSLWQESGADVNLFRQKLETWFDDTMQRATGWYKRYTRMMLFITGLLVAIVFNVDTIAIQRILSKDKVARGQLVQMAIANQDKYANEVGRIRRGDSATSDSILKNTYEMVKSDAASASMVLGLGRAWRDTVSLWRKDSTAWKEEQEKLRQVISKLQDSLAVQFDSTGKTKDSIARAVAAIRTNDSLKKAIARSQWLTTMIERGKYIDDRREDGKWYQLKWLAVPNSPYQGGGWETLLGWLITALAITLGAPFWFDLLSKLIKIRGSGTKIDSTDTSTSERSAATTAPQTAPVNINVNPNPGEEAVG